MVAIRKITFDSVPALPSSAAKGSLNAIFGEKSKKSLLVGANY